MLQISHVDDLDRLEREFRRLQELKTAGSSTYIAIWMESRLQAWHDTRASAGLEIQTQQSRVDQMEALDILGMAKDDLERSQVVISGKLELSKQKLAKIKQEAAKTLSLTEESFKVALQCELERTYTEELTKLEQQVRSHKLHVD